MNRLLNHGLAAAFGAVLSLGSIAAILTVPPTQATALVLAQLA